MLENVKNARAKPEPSTHGTNRTNRAWNVAHLQVAASTQQLGDVPGRVVQRDKLSSTRQRVRFCKAATPRHSRNAAGCSDSPGYQRRGGAGPTGAVAGPWGGGAQGGGRGLPGPVGSARTHEIED